MRGFVMTADIACKFYERCLEREAITEVEKLKILNELVHEYDVKILKEKQLRETLEGKKVLVVGTKEKKKC